MKKSILNEQEWTRLWLKYDKKKACGNERYVTKLALKGFSPADKVIESAIRELKIGVSGMLDIDLTLPTDEMAEKCMLLLRSDNLMIKKGGYHLYEKDDRVIVESIDEKGILYGIFHVLRILSTETCLKNIDTIQNPDNPLRVYNHWDNMDGSIERGYSGNSFFFCDETVIINQRTIDYARLVSSVGINAVVINNVNAGGAATELISDKYRTEMKQIGEIFERYGISLFLSLNYEAPAVLGGLDSTDPLDKEVIAWWKGKMEDVFTAIPNLGGFLVKVDSEGRRGPFYYGRTQAEGANMLADAVKPHGGIIIWRCFVYNCTQDWRDYKTDRARAAYDNFIETDGDYHDNVILQIKNGPMDFQIREPVSPLLGGLRKTNQMLEVQVAQEYTGQQIDVCYLIPMFKEVLDFKTYCSEQADTVADIVSGRTFGNRLCGMAAVCNTGNDANWTGNDLAAANFYGFGRLSFSTSLTAEEIAEEWIRMTFSNEDKVISAIREILLNSREIFEKYTCPLGIGWLVSAQNHHYGPGVDSYEYSRWGTYHRADYLGLGVDRTDSGTGYVRQYHEPNASMYNDAATCPEELLLFFHHLPYRYELSTGKTVIQHIYDTHFEGVEHVRKMIALWESIMDKVETEVWERVMERFDRQLINAKEWRDQVNSYFFRKSGIADEKGRKIF